MTSVEDFIRAREKFKTEDSRRIYMSNIEERVARAARSLATKPRECIRECTRAAESLGVSESSADDIFMHIIKRHLSLAMMLEQSIFEDSGVE